jgi:TRAP-type C4-dicarboxylate transport system substrate-binding protein
MMLKRIALAAVAVGLLATAADAQLKEFRYSSWTPPPAPNNRFGSIPYFAAIEAELKGTKDEIKFNNFMGGQLFNAITTLSGIRDGVVDAGVTVPVYNAAELKSHVTLGELQALTRDGYSAAAASTETLLLTCPGCVEDYARNNALTLGVYSSAPYHLMCNFEVKSIDDLKGRKSAEGSPVFARFSAQLGMSRLQLPPSEYLQALQRGTAECIFGPLDWLNAFSLKDVVKTVVEDVTHGVVPAVSIMTVNTNTWKNKLSSTQRQVLLKHMPDAIMRVVHGYYADEVRGVNDAKTKGVKFISLPALQKAWDEFRAKEMAIVIEGAKKRGVPNAEEIVKANLENLKKWEGIVDRVGRDPQKLADELRKQVFLKVGS